MSIIRDYIPEQGPDSPWQDERRRQLARIAQIRGRAVITYAARLSTLGLALPTAISFTDILPFHDLLDDLKGKGVDVILESPGGDGVVARDLVELLHEKFESVAFIVPGWAKSAGTIMAMGGDEILMAPASALGPIDAQLSFEGKQFSADALLEGIRVIQDETIAQGRLNPALIPMLQRISPGAFCLALANNSRRLAFSFAAAGSHSWQLSSGSWPCHDAPRPAWEARKQISTDYRGGAGGGGNSLE